MGGQVGGGKGRGGTWQKLLPLWAEQGQPRPVQPHLLQVQEKKHGGGSSQKLLGALRVAEPPKPPQNSHGGGSQGTCGGGWDVEGGHSSPKRQCSRAGSKGIKTGEGRVGWGWAWGGGWGYSELLTRPPKALLEPPELTRESSEGRSQGRAGEGVPPNVGQEVGAGFWGRLGRVVGGRAGLGGHRKVRGGGWHFPPGHPQKWPGLTCGCVPVSPWRSWGGSAVLLWGGCFPCSGATYLPRESKNID